MNKRAALALVTLLSLLLPGCAPAGTGGTDGEEARLTVLASTYPVYLAARSVAEGVEGVSVLRLETGAVSCLHDYTLTVGDMKKLEGADVVALNGAGMEEFMEDALASSSAPVIDCSAGVDLLESEGHVHQDGEEEDDHGHFDPHYWMDPENMEQMVYNIRDGLSQADPEHAGEYEENAAEQAGLLHTWDDALQDMIREAEENAGVEISGLITFHDGFRYFAEAFDLPLLASIEEEEGSEASAKEINEIAGLVKAYSLPVIFTEVNGSDATAQAIARETGCAVAQLSMCMDGPEEGTLSDYYTVLAGILLVVLVLWGVSFNQLMLSAVHPALADSRGVKVFWQETVFSVAIAVVVTVSMTWVGLLVINSLLVLPAAAARNVSRTMFQYHLVSLLGAVLAGIAGLMTSYYVGSSAGAAITLYLAVWFLGTFLARKKQ